jgi:uncharacterized protein YdcH (DUF465 family)
MDLQTLSVMATLAAAFASLAVFVHRENQQTRRDLRSDLSGLEVRFGQRFDQVDARFDQVDARFDQVDARFDRVEARVERLDDRVYALATGMKPLIEQAEQR